jgi:broad specificity phosphatase PhoE
MRIIVVRHGLAEAKKGWQGPDSERPLVARGRRQADRLGKVVGADRPDRVISSPARRCVQTVQPLAEKRKLVVELSPSLAIDAGRAAIELCENLLSTQPTGATVVLCTHREVLRDLLPQLSKLFGGSLNHRPPGAKGGAWILRFRNTKLQKVEYRPPAA